MFGLKLKSWMEAHLGRPRHKSTSHQNQKRAPKDSSTGLAGSSGSSANASISSTTNSTSSSSTNTTSSSSNSSTTTAIVGGGLALAANNPTFCNDTSASTNIKALDHLTHNTEKSFNFSSSVTTTSSGRVEELSSSSGGSELAAISPSSTTVEGQILDRRDEGGGSGGIIVEQKGDIIGAEKSGINSHTLGKTDHNHHQQPSISSNNCISNNDGGGGCRPSVTTSSSNSTSILSGSFSNSLSSPDTGYSTDGYSPKSVYPALSFDSGSSSTGNTKSTTSSSKSSYTISSLASSELLHSSKQTTSNSSIQNGLDEYVSAPSPFSPAALTTSQSTSSGISSGTSDSNCYPKGHQVHPHHHQHLENSLRLTQQKHQNLPNQHSIPEDDSEKQVIMGDGVDEEKGKRKNVELPLTPLADALSSDIDPLAKFAQLSIDLNHDIITSQKNNVRTHRRAESMDARTPCHEEYKPLVEEEDESQTVSESNSSLIMTASQVKNIRTSFVINGSGQIVEFSSYKNAYSICSPRRERTRIKTNPWITLNKKDGGAGGGGGNKSDSISHVNLVQNSSSSSEGESADIKKKTNMNMIPTSPLPSSSSMSSSCIPSKPLIALKSTISSSSGVGDTLALDTGKQNEMSDQKIVEKCNKARPCNNFNIIGNSNGVSIDPTFTLRGNLEINNKKEEAEREDHDHDRDHDVEGEEHFIEEESGNIDHDSSSLLYRISGSDSGKGNSNRNSSATESSCLLSDCTGSISHEAEHSSSRSGRSSSGESISSSRKHHHRHHHHHQTPDDDTLGHASPTSSDTGAALLFTSEIQKGEQQQQQHIHHGTATTAKVNSSINTVTASSNLRGRGESTAANTNIIGKSTSIIGKSTSSTATSTESAWCSDEQRSFRNAAVATDHTEISGFPKSASVSVGVGTTGSNKSSKFHPVMVDKETDILSDWANTDEDGDEDIETDQNDNETVTPAPSSPGTDVDRGLFSQSTSSATTDIDFGDSSAATQASSTAVFPPSSLVRHHRYSSGNGNNNNSNKSAFNRGNGPKFHNHNENNGCPNGGSGSGGEDDIMLSTTTTTSTTNNPATSQMLLGSFSPHQNHFTHQHNINMNLAGAQCYPSVPIIRPVLSAASQHQGPNGGIPDSYAYDITPSSVLVTQHGVVEGNGELANRQYHHRHHLHTFHPHASDTAAMCFTGVGGGGVVPNFNFDDETDYPEMKEPTHHKGLARGALGFLRKIFKKGACASQRHSPDSVKGKKSRGKSDNNLSTIGLGSPLLTISEPLSNPRYSAALTTKKQMNPALNGYFLTPTPNSFRRRSGTGTDSSDNSKGSKQNGTNGKHVKTDIIRLPQGPLSPQLHQQHTLVQQNRHHNHHHHHHQPASSSHSSGSSCSSTNGIPPPEKQHACSTFLSPSSTNTHQLNGILSEENNLVMASQSNTNHSNSTSSSIHSIMSTSTSAASAGIHVNRSRSPSQNQSHTPVPLRDPNYYANSSPASRQSSSSSDSNGNHNARGNRHSMSPPPLISENCSYINEAKNSLHQPDFHHHPPTSQIPPYHSSSRRVESNVHMQSPSIKGIPPYESPRLSATARMSSPSFNNYSPIHRLVVTGGSHILNKANSNNCHIGVGGSAGGGNFPGSGIPAMHYTNEGVVVGNGNTNPTGFPSNTQIINKPSSTGNHPTAITSPSPLINHRYPTVSTPYSSSMTSSQQQQQQHQNIQGHFFASPSPILRNPRYQYITSSNQNSPVLNASKRMNVIPSSHSHLIPQSGGSCNGSSNGLPSNPSGPPPLLTTFAPLPSSSSALRESLLSSNSFNTNTITGSPNLNSSDPFNNRVRQVVSSSLSYNEFENLTRQQQSYLFQNNCNVGSNTSYKLGPSQHQQQQHPTSNLLQQQNRHAIPHRQQQQQQPLHQSQKSEIHHKNHYYSSPIVKGVQQEVLHPSDLNMKQSLWEREGRMMMMTSEGNSNNESARHYQQRMNQNLRFNSFLVRHRKLPQFYHTQWGLQERIYETVDSEDENTQSDEMSPGAGGDFSEFNQDGNEIDCTSELSLPVEVHRRNFGPSFSQDEVDHRSFEQRECSNENREFFDERHKNNDFGYGNKSNESRISGSLHNESHPESFTNKKSKRSKPKSLSATGKPFPRPVVALPMMPGTFLSETETRLLEADKESDRKYKRLINEAEALLKEISVEKSKRGIDGSRDNNSFRLEDCPQSDPLRRKAYDCWALRRLQQELAGCCASPPVLHRSRLNLQSPSTPTVSNNPYLSHFQNLSTAQPPLPQEVSYMNSSGVDNNQNSFEF